MGADRSRGQAIRKSKLSHGKHVCTPKYRGVHPVARWARCAARTLKGARCGAKRFPFKEYGAKARPPHQRATMRPRLRLQIIAECGEQHGIQRDGFCLLAQQLRAQIG